MVEDFPNESSKLWSRNLHLSLRCDNSILMLLCLWRMINDIMKGFSDFKDVLDDFISGASPHIIGTKDGIDSYHHRHSRENVFVEC